MPIKVLFVCHGYVGGPVPLRAGAEIAAHALLSHLAVRGHAVRVAVTPGAHAPSEGYTTGGVHVLPGRETHAALWADDYDVLVTHLDASVAGLYAADRAAGGVPTVLLLHNDHKPTFQVMAHYLTFGKKRLAVANSDWVARAARRSLAQQHRLESVGVVTAHPLVPCLDYRVVKDRGRTVTLVNTTETKGGVLLARLAEQMPDTRFLAVCGAYGPQETLRYANLPNVALFPTTTDMRAVYAQTDVLMMGGSYESWGRVGVEAACSGIPTVSTPIPGPLEALGDTAIFVDREDLAGWERAIRSLLNDPVEYDRRSALCLERAKLLEAQARLEQSLFADAVETLTWGRG